MTEYSWHLGTTGTEMGSTSGRACFLTRVTGDFRRDRFVRIRISNGSWVLGGSRVVTAADVGVVNASARCSRVYSYTDEYYWKCGTSLNTLGKTACHGDCGVPE